MSRALIHLCGPVACLLASAATASAQALLPPPLPMAGRVFPVYPLYPAYGAVPIAYAKETFAAADTTGYALYLAPANYWSVPTQDWRSIPHPQTAEVVARFTAPAVPAAPDGAALYDAGLSAYWAGDHPQAVSHLEAAAVRTAWDARPWYYLAMARWAAGDDAGGWAAARQAAAVTAVYPEANAGALAALERVQGPLRWRLNAAAASIATREEAEAELARASGR
jgi:hypothetical protein